MPKVVMQQSSQQQQPARNEQEVVSEENFFLDEEVSRLISTRAFDDAFLAPTISRSTSKRSTPVSNLAVMQDVDDAFFVPTSSRSASKRSTLVLQLAFKHTVDHSSNPLVLTPIGMSGTTAVNGSNIPRSNSTSHLSNANSDEGSQLGLEDCDDVLQDDEPNTNGIVD
jgi:hypothetical protein